MSAGVHEADPGPLPRVLPIFPLPGALLLPRGRLPLNIFEPRYLNMIEDALGSHRLIGMIQPREAVEDPVPDDARLYGVGCVGRITSFSESGDGRFLITLTGVSRFTVAEELEAERGYRRVAADYARFAADIEAESDGRLADRKRLLAAVKTFFEKGGIEADWPAMKAVPDDALVTALAMVCPLEPREKQALLECPSLAERGVFLMNILEFATRTGEDDAPLRPQ